MPKLVRIETIYNFWVADLTDQQLERYNEDADDDGEWEVIQEVEDDFELVREKDGGIEYHIEED